MPAPCSAIQSASIGFVVVDGRRRGWGHSSWVYVPPLALFWLLARQAALCAFQWAAWQAPEQYATSLQALQIFDEGLPQGGQVRTTDSHESTRAENLNQPPAHEFSADDTASALSCFRFRRRALAKVVSASLLQVLSFTCATPDFCTSEMAAQNDCTFSGRIKSSRC